MGEGAPSMSLGSSPATPKSVHRNLTKHLLNLRDTVRTALVNGLTQAETKSQETETAEITAGTRIRGWRGAPRRKYRKRI